MTQVVAGNGGVQHAVGITGDGGPTLVGEQTFGIAGDDVMFHN